MLAAEGVAAGIASTSVAFKVLPETILHVKFQLCFPLPLS